jgi:hypothetical protein
MDCQIMEAINVASQAEEEAEYLAAWAGLKQTVFVCKERL